MIFNKDKWKSRSNSSFHERLLDIKLFFEFKKELDLNLKEEEKEYDAYSPTIADNRLE